MLFKGPDDALQWVRDVRQTAAPVRNELGRRVAQGFLYYEGIHWIEEDRADTRNGLRRLQTNYNPDTNQLRVTANQVSYRIQKVMASTFPDRLAVEAIPPDRDFSATTIQLAKACQDAVNFGIDESGYLKARRNANANRCIAGTWGIGFSLATYAKVVNGETVDDACLKAFDFDPLRLTLDPYMESSDLNDHEVVVYSDAWTHRKLTRLFGIRFTSEQMENLQEIGQITAYEQAIAAVSSGRIMSHYRTHSKTKGALVHQIHAKSPGSDRFDMMYVVVEMGKEQTYIPKGFEGGMETPFGGSGLPLALLHAHHRPRSPWGISDVMMMKEDQNLLNLFKTAEARMMVRSAGFQILLDKRSVPKGTTNDDARNMFSNTVSGVVQWESSDRNRGVTPPQVLQYPQPPQHLSEVSAWHTEQIREKSHRAEGTFGQTKCIDGNSKVLMADGTRRAIRNIRAGDEVVAIENGKHVTRQVLWHTASGTKPCLKIRGDRGYIVTATADHRILTDRGWKVAGDLQAGDYLIAPKRLPMPEHGDGSMVDEAVVTAIWLAEGDKTRMDTYAITNGLEPVRNELIAIAERRGWGVRIDRWLRIRLLKNGQPDGPNELLKRHNLRTMRTNTIRVPEFVMSGSYETVTTFLRYLWACDGCASGKGIYYTSNSREFLDDIRSLLLRFGIRCSIGPTCASHTLNIQEQNAIIQFAEHIGIVGKDDALQSVVAFAATRERGSNNYFLPGWTRDEIAHGSKWYKTRIGHRLTRDNPGGLAEHTAQTVCEWEDAPTIRAMLASDVEYIRFKDATPVGDRETFDMEVEGSHNFIADGLVVHNSHVPDSSFQRALDEADQVLGARVRNDTQTDGVMLTTMLGTLARLAKDDNPSTLAMLNRAGLSGDDINALGKLDPQKPIITVSIRESSVRYRSRNARVQDLLTALQSQAIDPIRYRTEMARTLDSPIVEMDGVMVNAAAKAVQDILLGKEWEPVPLAEYTTVFQDQFRAAMFDKKATPEARQRLQRAISNQLAMDAKERGMSDPAMDIQRQNAEIEADAQAGEQVEASLGDTPAEPQTLHDVLTAMEGTTSAASSATTIPYTEPTV